MSSKAACAKTMVFPAVGQTALEYIIAAKSRNEQLVLAASVAGADSVEGYALHRIPSINDENFEAEFFSFVVKHEVVRLVCPVSTVYAFMARFISTRHLGIALIGQSPVSQQIDSHRRLMDRVQKLLPLVSLCAEQKSSLLSLEVAAVVRQASAIYGESNDEKLAAMMGIFATAPSGDVIEIGSLMGRSAFVLLYLAWRFQVGPLITVDPWSAAKCYQRDSPESLQHVTDEWDFEVLRDGFMLNLLASRPDDHSHLRMPSTDAFEVYASGAPLLSLIGSPIQYSRKISVIHVDGNHDYDAVRQDCELWLSKMLPGSWLILDDYIWAHGDGPYRVGNELLHSRTDQIDRAFVCGKALFVKFCI